MNINIKATHTTLTSSIENKIHEKFASLEKFLKPEDKLFVEVEADAKHKSGDVFRAEVTISPRNLYADARGEELYAAIDMLIPKIKEQLVKQKDKEISLRRELGAERKGNE